MTLIRTYNLNNTYTASLFENRTSIVKLGPKDRHEHLQRCRNMCDGASAVEMLSALPYQRVEGRERCRKKKGKRGKSRTEREVSATRERERE